MSYGDVRKVSRQDIQLVQNLIERCLQLYMNQKEVVDTLLTQAKIEPGFTELVWQKLEEENPEFFKAYRARLLLKDQILVFNELLEKQVELMRKVYPSGVSNGSNTSTLNQIPSCHDSTSSRPDSTFRNGGSSLSVVNGGPLVPQTIQAGNDSSIINRNLDASTSMLSRQTSQVGRLNHMDGPTIKSEPSYSSPSDFAFGANDSFLEACPTIEDTSCASFNSLLLTEPPLNEPLGTDTSSFGFLSQIPRNFSFSDLTNDFSQDILVNYGKSPYLAPETNNFTDSPDREFQDDENWRLDTISEGISYDDFGSD